MSLINDVLKQLEKNKDKSRRKMLTLAGITKTSNKQRGEMRWQFIYWTIIIVIATSAIYYYYPRLSNEVPRNLATLKKKILASNIWHKKQPAVPQAPVQPVVPPLVMLQNILLEQKDNQTILDLVLSAATPFWVERVPEQLNITLSNTGMQGNLPVSLDKTFIASLNTRQTNNSIISSLNLLPGTKVEELQLIDKPEPHLHIVLTNSQISSSSLTKVPAVISPDEQALEQYQEIQQLLREANTQSAIEKLHLFIGDFPDHTQARTTLVSLLIKEGRLQKAEDIVMVGLAKYSGYLPFIKLRARILIEQHKTAEAIELLQKHVTSGMDDEEYLALLAKLYFDIGSFMAAAELYNILTKMEPHKYNWWLGLGSALENAGKRNGANEAYQHAVNSSDIPPDVKSFIGEKIK